MIDLRDYVRDNGSATVAGVMAYFGTDRHEARHSLEALLADGIATKAKDGRTVVYSFAGQVVTKPDSLIAVPEPVLDATTLSVIGALRPRKALSLKAIRRRLVRAGQPLNLTKLREALLAAVVAGRAECPFTRSERYRLAAA